MERRPEIRNSLPSSPIRPEFIGLVRDIMNGRVGGIAVRGASTQEPTQITKTPAESNEEFLDLVEETKVLVTR